MDFFQNGEALKLISQCPVVISQETCDFKLKHTIFEIRNFENRKCGNTRVNKFEQLIHMERKNLIPSKIRVIVEAPPS